MYEQVSLTVTGDEIFVFALNLGKVQEVRMYKRSSDNRCCFDVESLPNAAKVTDMIVASTE